MSDDKANERSELWASEMDASDAKDAEEPEDTQSAWDTESIRDDWHANSVRLPKHLQNAWDAEHKKVDYELTQQDVEIDYSKDRWYKPLVIALGLSKLQSMDITEVETALEEMQENGMVE